MYWNKDTRNIDISCMPCFMKRGINRGSFKLKKTPVKNLARAHTSTRNYDVCASLISFRCLR